MWQSLFLIALIPGSIRDEHISTDQVDLIEYNHFYDEMGKLVFDQIVFYDWSPGKSRYQVVDWRLCKKQSQVPRYNHRSKRYVAIWHDGPLLRCVVSVAYRETWTQYDPELVERDFLPKEQRRGLRKPLSVKKPDLSRETQEVVVRGTRTPAPD